MANNKTGLNYYNVDTDRYMDIRIRRLVKDHGCKGLAVYDYLLCEVYRVQGCFVVWDEVTAFNVAEYLGLKESNVFEIVRYCGAVGLFDKELLSRGIITSASIQRRYLEICNRSKRKISKIPEECLIIPEESQITPEVCTQRKEKNISTTSTTTARDESDYPKPSVNDFSDTPQKGSAEKVPPLQVAYGVTSCVPIKELPDYMKSNTVWFEAFCMNNHLDPEYVKRKIDEFGRFCEDNGEVEKDRQDCFRHFNNWLRKVQQQPKPKATPASRPTTASRHPATMFINDKHYDDF